MTISRIFELGKRTLLSYQSAINTTAGNVSNANNEHYARRRVDLSRLTAAGMGWNMSERMRSQIAQQQLWSAQQDLGQYEASEMMLQQMENIFAENTEASLASVLNQFWNAWGDLANDPESEYARTIVKDKAVMLANTFKRQHAALNKIRQEMRPELHNDVDNINLKLNRLNQINKELRRKDSAALLDQRDQILGELSKIMDIKVKESDNGEVKVLTQGLVLISDNQVNELRITFREQDGQTRAQLLVDNLDRAITPQSGELSALMDVHNEQLPAYVDKLDQLAQHIAAQVNSLHKNGVNTDGSSGIPFFSEHINSAADLIVNPAIVDTPALIASRNPGEGEGSGSAAQAISDLQFRKFVSGNTAGNFLNAMYTQLGNSIEETTFARESQELIVQQLKNQKESVTGISLDEEMTRMVQYEQAYEAAARIVNTVDEMVETVLSLK